MNRVDNVLVVFKQNLFTLSSKMRQHTRREIMDELAVLVSDVIESSTVIFVLHNKWNFGNQVTYFASTYPIKNLKEQPSDNFMKQFEKYDDVADIVLDTVGFTSHENKQANLLKVRSKDNYDGVVLLEYDDNLTVDPDLLQEIREDIEIFLEMIFLHRHDLHKMKRDEFLFDLSSRLHSVHSTEKTLELVIEAIRSLFPVFNYTLLMSKDYQTNNVPIKLFDYTNETSTGALAFINNTLQVDVMEADKVTDVYAPLTGHQGVYGVLKITIPQLVKLSADEVHLLEKFSMMFGRTLERTTLYESSNRRVSDLEIINAASHELNATIESDSILAVAKRYIIESSKPEEIGIISFMEDDRQFNILADSSFYFETAGGKEFAEYVYDRMSADPTALFYGEFLEAEIDIPYASLIVIPLIESEKVLGAIILLHPTSYYFSFDKFKFIKSFIQHVSLALTNSLLREKLNKLASTDYLTGLYARTYLDKQLTAHMQTGEKGIFILFDIDDFKKVNDTHGHIVGDKVLKQVAAVLQGEMKVGDIAARWGGEEFAVYLPDRDNAYGAEIAENIRLKVLQSTHPNVSISSGLTYWNAGEDDSVRKLFIRADDGLYEAKKAGKNTSIIVKRKTEQLHGSV